MPSDSLNMALPGDVLGWYDEAGDGEGAVGYEDDITAEPVCYGSDITLPTDGSAFTVGTSQNMVFRTYSIQACYGMISFLWRNLF